MTTPTNTRQQSVHCTQYHVYFRHLEWFGRRNIYLDSWTGVWSAHNTFLLQRQGLADYCHISMTDIAGSLPGCISCVPPGGPEYGHSIQTAGAYILPCFGTQENSSSKSVIINYTKYFIVQTGFHVSTV